MTLSRSFNQRLAHEELFYMFYDTFVDIFDCIFLSEWVSFRGEMEQPRRRAAKFLPNVGPARNAFGVDSTRMQGLHILMSHTHTHTHTHGGGREDYKGQLLFITLCVKCFVAEREVEEMLLSHRRRRICFDC